MTKLKELEQLFFKVVADLKDYLPYLVLVGGWLPYLYTKYLWKNLSVYPVTTSDIDFGLPGRDNTPRIDESIYARFSKLHYKERHLRMDRLFPVVHVLENKDRTSRLLIEFLTAPDTNERYIDQLIGHQILVNRLDKFDILLKQHITIGLVNYDLSPHSPYFINVPPPSLFLFHKALVFPSRENEIKMSKDVYYLYYILRYHPDKKELFNGLNKLELVEEKSEAAANLIKYFSKKTSQGCLMVEKENGPDDYVVDIKRDAFERFRELIEVLSSSEVIQ